MVARHYQISRKIPIMHTHSSFYCNYNYLLYASYGHISTPHSLSRFILYQGASSARRDSTLQLLNAFWLQRERNDFFMFCLLRCSSLDVTNTYILRNSNDSYSQAHKLSLKSTVAFQGLSTKSFWLAYSGACEEVFFSGVKFTHSLSSSTIILMAAVHVLFRSSPVRKYLDAIYKLCNPPSSSWM